MKKEFYIGFVIFLISTVPVIGQDFRELKVSDLIGYWQTDSVSQLGAKKSGLAVIDSPFDKTLSDDMDRAVNSREYIFYDGGIFIANWMLGGRSTTVRGRWDIVDNNRITIEVNGTKTQYSVNAQSKEGIVLVPLREHRGEIHQLYFIKKKEK